MSKELLQSLILVSVLSGVLVGTFFTGLIIISVIKVVS